MSRPQPSLCHRHDDRRCDADLSSTEAFDLMVERHLPELQGVALKLCGCAAEADDLLQETILRAWRFWDNFELGTNRRAWLFRILRNTAKNRFKRNSREREFLSQLNTSPTHGVGPASLADLGALVDEELGEEIDAALSALPQDYRVVVVLVDLHDESYREVAEHLGCPVGTVMSRLHRARRQLKGLLEAYGATAGHAPMRPGTAPAGRSACA